MSVQMAPQFTLSHVVGRPVSLADYRGHTVVLLFAGRDSSEQAKSITRTLRAHYGPDQLPILSVLDLHALPKLIQGMAKGQLQKAYQSAVAEATAGAQAMGRPMPADSSQAIVMLPDWDGSVTRSYGLNDVNAQAVAVLVDGNGYIRGYGAGEQGGNQVIALFGQQ